MQPLLYLALFGPLLEPLAGTFGADNAYALFVPGLLVQLGLFGALFAGFGLVAEWRAGVIEAERVTPASRTALLFGRVLLNAVQLLVQAIVLVLLGFAFGLRASAGGIVFGHRADRAARGRVRLRLQRDRPAHEERGRAGAAAEQHRAARAAAVGHPAADHAARRG